MIRKVHLNNKIAKIRMKMAILNSKKIFLSSALALFLTACGGKPAGSEYADAKSDAGIHQIYDGGKGKKKDKDAGDAQDYKDSGYRDSSADLGSPDTPLIPDASTPDFSIIPDAPPQDIFIPPDTSPIPDLAVIADAHLPSPDLDADLGSDLGPDMAPDLGIDLGVDAGSPFEQNLALLKEKLQTLLWVSYAPTNFDPTRGIYPGTGSLETDLTLLYNTGFRGIITYGAESTLEDIPRIAKEVGFEGVIMGLWLPNALQMGNGINQREHVEGYCLGNENLDRSYSLEQLTSAMEELRAETDKPVSTTEELNDYLLGVSREELMAASDWVFPNVHPFWSGVREGEAAAQWTINRYNQLRERVPADKVLMFKEVGLPTEGCPSCSEENQRNYYQVLNRSSILFSHFEAFDQPWKDWHPVEPHWGLFYSDRELKLVVGIF